MKHESNLHFRQPADRPNPLLELTCVEKRLGMEARRPGSRGKTIVVLFPDAGGRCLSTPLFSE